MLETKSASAGGQANKQANRQANHRLSCGFKNFTSGAKQILISEQESAAMDRRIRESPLGESFRIGFCIRTFRDLILRERKACTMSYKRLYDPVECRRFSRD